jgi:hypothetical protein
MKTKKKYFRKGDIVVYTILIIIFGVFSGITFNMKDEKASNVEIYVSGKLQYLYPLTVEEKNIFVDTEIGGVNVRFKDMMVCVTSSNSPLQICVKQGWIKNPGETIIGIPDKLIIKITGSDNKNNNIDYIIR